MFSPKLFGIFGLGQTDQPSTSLPSFQPQNTFLNFKSLKEKCYICFIIFFTIEYDGKRMPAPASCPQKGVRPVEKAETLLFFYPSIEIFKVYHSENIPI